MVNKVKIKLLAIVLTIVTLLNVISPMYTYAVSYSSQLGTNTALGSPLLNESFNYEDWNKWELVTFGVFASNFTKPLVDSYKTAFTVNNEGSAGAGREALEFGSGSDSSANKALAAMLDYVVKNQTSSSGKTLKAIYTNIDGTTSVDEEPKQATILDLLIYPSDQITMTWDIDIESRLTNEGPSINSVSTRKFSSDSGADGYEAYLLNSAKLCRLVTEGSDGQDEIVFDWRNGWDAQMMAVWIASIVDSEYADKALDNLKAMIEAKTPLFLDTFGNICGNLNGENIVIIPSASNCHIYNDGERYNLLNSVVLSEAYTKASGQTLVNSLEAYKWGVDGAEAGNPLKSDDLEEGDVIVYFDSDQSLFDSINKYRSKLLSSTDADIKVNWGSELIKLLNSRLDNSTTSSSLSIRLEVIGGERTGHWFKFRASELERMAEDIVRCANMLVHFYPPDSGKETLAKITTEKGDAPLFQSAVYVPVNLYSDNYSYKSVVRSIVNSSFRYLDGTESASSAVIDMPKATVLRGELMELQSMEDVANWLFYDSSTGSSEYISKFVKNNMLGSGKQIYVLPDNIQQVLQSNLKWKELSDYDIKLQNKSGVFGSTNPKEIVSNDDYESSVERVLKVYTQNENMKNAMNVLNVREGTEFAIWTPRVYLTYLEWFGVIDGNNKFNESLFDISSDILNKDAEELFEGTFLTKEEKEAEILDYTYMMLHPTEGREYRADLMMNWFTDWMYRTYENIVYGNGVTSYNSENGTSELNSAGFFKIDTYQENFMTSWFIEGYSKYAIGLMGILLVAIVVIGVLNQKTLAWFLVSILIMVNMIIITPTTGEFTPYVVNNMVQKMFNENMTYWAMSESIENAKIEAQLSTVDTAGQSGLTTSDYVRMLNVVYLDRAIMLKTDISKKITEDSTGIISEIQSLQSARWLLPTLIRQFTASDNSANYVYQSLGDMYDNWSNMYWVYNPEDKLSVQTANANTVEDPDPSTVPNLGVDSKSGRYAGYDQVTADVIVNNTEETAEYLTYPWQSTSRLKDDEDVFHAGFYLIPGLLINDANGDWDTYAETLPTDADAFKLKAIEMEQEASSYSPSSKGATANMGFLWTTENPGVYFYGVVKDTFGSSKTLASLTADLQGYYKGSSYTGDDERQSFMHYQDTGLIRDFLDMEELFKNVIPYMYSVQLLAGGTDGTNGVLGDSKMTSYSLYEDNYKSWLFRSNWVTKLLEDSDLTRPAKIGDGKGNKVTVENPMLPSSYEEAGREMVFSEAQMYMQGLTEADLSIVELKILDVNDAVEKKWTLLLNYVNTPDITTEVFYRQMATDALLEFNKEFSPDRLINGSKALYPTSLDLRSISFDSVMKMLMINSTRDSSYIYGDTMKQVIENSDIFSGIFLLISAFLCSFLIPLLRNIVLGLIFYIGIWSVITNILAGGLTKLKISAAFAINNVVYTVLTICYYGVFALLISTSTADSVLSLDNIVVDAGPPTWQFLIIIITSLIYVYFSYRLIKFTIKNFRDMGFEVYAAFGSMLTSKITKGINGLYSMLHKGNKGTSSASSIGGTHYESNKYTENTTSNTIKDIDKKERKRKNKNSSNTYGVSGYNLDNMKDTKDDTKENFFDKEADKGSKIK